MKTRATVLFLAALTISQHATAGEPADPRTFVPRGTELTTIPDGHVYSRALVANALEYTNPFSPVINLDGTPTEGYNRDPELQFDLRGFTQLTAIGKMLEFYAAVVAGDLRTPAMSRERALDLLMRLTATLRKDQANPQISVDGVLVNFIDLSEGKRRPFMHNVADLSDFVQEFGTVRGAEIWKALGVRGWLSEIGDGKRAGINRLADYGPKFFTGTLSVYADEETATKIMNILEHRDIHVFFGDNANLTASVGLTIGALLRAEERGERRTAVVRQSLEEFLDAQRPGYMRLYDANAGRFAFGYDATHDRFDGSGYGRWPVDYYDSSGDEFRAPAIFVQVRNDLPVVAIGNLGFTMRRYTTLDGRDLWVVGTNDGSAFQSLGLGLTMPEMESPVWRKLLTNAVSVHIDAARKYGVAGLLSECYTGAQFEYTGTVGVPQIATMSDPPRVTYTGSAYELGTAYSINPELTEQFLGSIWGRLRTTFTPHGVLEGYNNELDRPTAIQTTPHVVSLIVGFLGTGPDNMKRYLAHRGLTSAASEHYRIGSGADFLAPTARSVQPHHYATKEPSGADLSGCVLHFRYTTPAPAQVNIVLQPVGPALPSRKLLPKQISLSLEPAATSPTEVVVQLPTSVGLRHIGEVVVQPAGSDTDVSPIAVQTLNFVPILPAHEEFARGGLSDRHPPEAPKNAK